MKNCENLKEMESNPAATMKEQDGIEINEDILDTYEEWEKQQENVRTEYVKQFQRSNGYTLSLLSGAILFFNAFQQMQKIRAFGIEKAGTQTIIFMAVSLIIAIGLFLYASHLRRLRYKEYSERMHESTRPGEVE